MLAQIRLSRGDARGALAYAKRMYQVTHLRAVTDAVNCLCECYKRIDGDGDPNVRAFLELQKLGPNGPDGKPNTGDDIADPLASVGAPDEADLVEVARAAIAQTKPLNPSSRGRLWMLAGNYPRAMREFMNAYGATQLETFTARGPKRMTQATGEIATALKAIDGHVHRANRFLLYQHHGPAGADGEPGTDDDLTNPLSDLPSGYWAKHAPPDKQLDAAFQAAMAEQPDTHLGHRARGRLYLAWGKPDQGQAVAEARETVAFMTITDQDVAAFRPDEADQAFQQGCLSGAVLTHQGVDLARPHANAGVSHSRLCAV